jgi:hypothetical protein
VSLLRRRPLLDPDTLPEGLGVDWSRWSDGRAYRLMKRRDFPNVDPGHARTACEHAALQMGKVARTARDKRVPDKMIWVQFAEFEIREGEPCPRCGSRRILRLHAGFGRCPQCETQMLLSQQGLEEQLDDEDEGRNGPGRRQRTRMGDRLRALQNVHLERSGSTGEGELYNGYGERNADVLVILAEFDPGDEELSPENMYDRIRLFKALPARLFDGVFDVDALAARPDSDWDLVL